MKVKLSYILLLLAFLLAINQMFSQFIVYFFCLIAHEYTHIFVAKKLGYSTSSAYLTPFGATASVNAKTFYHNHELIIAISGPLLNFILLILTMASWWLFPQIYTLTYNFAASNFALCFFNLLPIYPLDGSKILSYFIKKKKFNTRKIIILINILSSIIFVIFSFILKNMSFCLMAVLFVLSLCEKQSVISPSILNTNDTSNLPLNTIVVNQNTKLYKLNKMLKPNSLNRFFVIDKNLKINRVINQNQLVDLFSQNASITELKDLK